MEDGHASSRSHRSDLPHLALTCAASAHMRDLSHCLVFVSLVVTRLRFVAVRLFFDRALGLAIPALLKFHRWLPSYFAYSLASAFFYV